MSYARTRRSCFNEAAAFCGGKLPDDDRKTFDDNVLQ